MVYLTQVVILKRALALMVLAIILLITLELAMRYIGYNLQNNQEQGNEIGKDDNKLIKIIAIGESTTADYFSEPPISSWPRQLEKMLNKHGKYFRVYNLGIPGTTTSHILSSLEKNIETYKPDIAITMMGINDPQAIYLEQPEKLFYSDFKIYKLIKWSHLAISRIGYTEKLPEKAFNNVEVKKIVNDLTSLKLSVVKKDIISFMINMDKRERAQLLFYLAKNVLPEMKPPPSNEHKNSYLLLKWSLEEFFSVENAVELYLGTMMYLNDYSDCLRVSKKYLEHYKTFDDQMINRIWKCAESSLENPEWFSLLRQNPQELDPKVSQYKNENTRKNYLEFNEIMVAKKIRHISMQYPTMNVDWLRASLNDFKIPTPMDEQLKSFTFVSNKENFSNASKIKKYEELFIDRLFGSFGHTSNLGNFLIAKAACEGLKRSGKENGQIIKIECN